MSISGSNMFHYQALFLSLYLLNCSSKLAYGGTNTQTDANIVNDVNLLVSGNFPKVETFEDFTFNMTLNCSKYLAIMEQLFSNETFTKPSTFQLVLHINDSDIANFCEANGSASSYSIKCRDNTSKVVALNAGHLGITGMWMEVLRDDNLHVKLDDVQIRVKREFTLFDKLSFFILGPLVLLNKCAFGAKIEINVMKHIFTQPLALTLCLLMQFVAMPLLAVLYSKLFLLSQDMALALFVGAVCPGGGGGYVISYLVGGDVTLAISASLLSTVVAMGAMPGVVGVYTYIFQIPDNIAIPYIKILLMLLAIAIPISTGMFINYKWPKFAKKFVRIIHPLSLFLIFSGLAYLAVSSKYIIHGPVIGWALAVCLPMSGFILSILFARALGLSWPFSKAISLESGMKNTVLGIAVIELSYPQPEADLASILIIMVTLGHTTLAMLWYFVHLMRIRCCKTTEVRFSKLTSLDADDDEDSMETAQFLTSKN